MRGKLITFFVLIAMIAATAAQAKPRRGFHTGPYLLLEGGAVQNDYDQNQRTGLNVGTSYEPTVGFLFGWNVNDWLAAELNGRYSTSKFQSKREHIAMASLCAKFFLITGALTDFPTLRILPFGKLGIAFRVTALPGDPSAVNDDVLTSFAYGPAVGAGIMFLWKKYVYWGFNTQGDLLIFQEKRQDINDGGTIRNMVIYRGGFIPQFSATALLGVHF